MHLIQILLPRTGDPRHQPAFALTRAELIEAFSGVTAYVRSAAAGAWTAPDGQVERDEVVMVEVLVAEFDRPWWRSYGRKLATRFHQDEIHIRALPAERP